MAGACIASSPDSDLEAFSHNPTHGSFAPLATSAWHFPAATWAQAYPVKPVRYIVPFPAGGIGDAVARKYAEKLTAALNCSISHTN